MYFHAEEMESLLFRDVMDLDDVRMAEPGDRARLALEPFDERGIGAEGGRQDFQGDRPVQR